MQNGVVVLDGVFAMASAAVVLLMIFTAWEVKISTLATQVSRGHLYFCTPSGHQSVDTSVDSGEWWPLSVQPHLSDQYCLSLLADRPPLDCMINIIAQSLILIDNLRLRILNKFPSFSKLPHYCFTME